MTTVSTYITENHESLYARGEAQKDRRWKVVINPNKERREPSHHDGRRGRVESHDNVSFETRGQQLVKASREQEVGDHVRGKTLKAEKEIARFAWRRVS